MNKKLHSSLIAFSLLFAPLSNFAQDVAYCSSCETECNDCECPEPCKDQCDPCPKVDSCNSCGCNLFDCCCECVPKPSCEPPCDAAFNAPWRMGVCWDVFLTGSFIYWEAIEGGLEVGLAESTSPNVRNLTTIDMDFEYKPGFKVGLGFNFDCDYWDFYSEYTWLHQTVSVSNASTTENPIFAHWTSLEGTEPYNLKTSWNLDFDMLDFELGRTYYVGCKLLFRPHFGGRAIWIDQTYNQSQEATNSDAGVAYKGNSSSWALGARSGLQTKWMFCSGFYFFGDAGSSLLFTDMDITAKITPLSGGVVTETTNYLHDNKYSLTPEFDLALGLGWGDYCDSCSKWYLTIDLGYEFIALLNQNPLPDFAFLFTSDTNLYFHGLTLKLRLDF